MSLRLVRAELDELNAERRDTDDPSRQEVLDAEISAAEGRARALQTIVDRRDLSPAIGVIGTSDEACADTGAESLERVSATLRQLRTARDEAADPATQERVDVQMFAAELEERIGRARSGQSR